MEFFEIKDKQKYNDIIKRGQNHQFVQSWEWGEFQATTGNAVYRYGLGSDLAFTLIKKPIGKRLGYYYTPRIDWSRLNEEEINFLLRSIKEKAVEQAVIFCRLEPLEKMPDKLDLPVQKTIDVQPSRTIVLDIANDTDKLLENMKQKTRYNIRLAEKKGVVCREGSPEDFAIFWDLMKTTGTRDSFRTHDREYYQRMLMAGKGDLKIKIYLAEWNGQVLCANIVSVFGDTATYVHGASSNQNRNVMAPYLLQWHIIKEAKEMGCKYYDFFGIHEQKWPGVTRFKQGFGGQEISYPGAFDVVFKSWLYRVYTWGRRIRRFF